MAPKIRFEKSGKTEEWEKGFANLMDFAEAKGVALESGCRVGTCGACKLKLISGKAVMETEEGLTEEDKAQGLVLPCVAFPETDLTLEA